MLITEILLVIVGGATGTLLRYWITTGIKRLYNKNFELSTLIVNCLGCLIMGVLIPFSNVPNPNTVGKCISSLLCVGFCGSLTTFSSYVEHFSYNLYEKGGNIGIGILEIISSIIVCFASLIIGLLLSKQLLVKKLSVITKISGTEE